MILFITTSYDATVDLLIGRADPGETFRLNYDLWQDYSLDFTHRGWRISDPTGRTIGSDTVTACFWWKAFNDFLTGTDPYVADEVRYHLRDLYGWCAARGITSGNPPDFHNRLGKLTILRMASRYFPVPATSSGWNVPDRRIPHPVAKSLSSTPVGDGRVLYAQAVEESRLDPQYPWTLQERVDAEFDATVFLCGRDLFAFRRDRLHLQGLDWRVEVFDQDVAPWERFALSPEDHTSLLDLSSALGVRFGRYDFLQQAGVLSFLEFNANGQWGFLDPQGTYGLVPRVLRLIRGS